MMTNGSNWSLIFVLITVAFESIFEGEWSTPIGSLNWKNKYAYSETKHTTQRTRSRANASNIWNYYLIFCWSLWKWPTFPLRHSVFDFGAFIRRMHTWNIHTNKQTNENNQKKRMIIILLNVELTHAIMEYFVCWNTIETMGKDRDHSLFFPRFFN